MRTQVWLCGIYGGQSGTGEGFLRVLRFPLPILISPTAPHTSSLGRSWYNRPVVPDAPSGLSLTPLQENKLKNYAHHLEVVGLERGPLSLGRIIEELLEWLEWLERLRV
jgi:hypothetical protein